MKGKPYKLKDKAKQLIRIICNFNKEWYHKTITLMGNRHMDKYFHNNRLIHQMNLSLLEGLCLKALTYSLQRNIRPFDLIAVIIILLR